MNPIFYTLSGLAVGAIVGMTGVGGGSLMTPLLVLAFGVHPVSAVGTDLLYASITKAAGSTIHGRNGTILWRVAGLLMLGSIPAALASVILIRNLHLSPAESGSLVSRALGLCLIASSVTVTLRNHIVAFAHSGATELNPKAQSILTVVVGAIVGALVSFTSVGAGALGVTALILLYPRAPIVGVVGTDIVHAVPLTLIAGLAHAANGVVDFTMLVYLLAGSIPGIVIGSIVAPRMRERWLRFALALVLIVVGLKLVV